MNKLLLLAFLPLASHATSFPSKYICDDSHTISIEMKGTEQRLVFHSSKYGSMNGYLDVFMGTGIHQSESIGNIHGLSTVRGKAVAFTLMVEKQNEQVDRVQYSFKTESGPSDEGNCVEVKNSTVIYGSNNY